MRAMAHPARIAILQHLGEGAEATATECAEICGLSPSATSYHLRALAKVGLVEEAPSRGDGRERVWRSPNRGFVLDIENPAIPDAVPAALALVDVVMQRDEAVLRQWLEKVHEIAQDDSDSVILHRSQVVVTPAELEELRAEIVKVLEPYSPMQRAEPPAGARRVITLFRAFPSEPPEPRRD
jgi:DNA-binding transcriptional ArsR family regulator